MTPIVVLVLNVGLVGLLAYLVKREGLLGYARGGKWYLSWFAVGLITLIHGGSVYRSIYAMLELLQEELDGRELTVHFGWPTSSWIDRMATGVFVANLMRLPGMFPRLRIAMEYLPAAPAAPAIPVGEAVAS